MTVVVVCANVAAVQDTASPTAVACLGERRLERPRLAASFRALARARHGWCLSAADRPDSRGATARAASSCCFIGPRRRLGRWLIRAVIDRLTAAQNAHDLEAML